MSAIFGITVLNLDRAKGTQGISPQDFWFVQDNLVQLLGGRVRPHGPSPHVWPPMVEGSSWMFINNIPVCHQTHKAACKHPTTGRDWWFIAP